MTIKSKPVLVSEFSYVYNKNNNNSQDKGTEKSVREYLDLYTNFRLKVLSAEELGLDTAQSFKTELEGYRKQLAQPYLTEKSVTEKLVKEAYDRSKEEISASHILISVSPDADPKDSLAAYKKISDIRQRVVKGEDFKKLAQEFSQDPSAKFNGGSLGYFTSLQMVYPFENAAYNTPKGEVSQIVRTRFGYHILKVADRRASQGEVKVAHIMLRATSGMPADDSLAVKSKIDELYNKLKSGGDWNTLCSQFSDDQGSKGSGGELPLFGVGAIGVPTFENAAFGLKNPGDIATPVQTPYGWHIIKLIERKNLGTFEELKGALKTKVSRDQRAEMNKVYLIERLKVEDKLVEKPKVQKAVFARIDSNAIKNKWDDLNIPSKEKEAVLFTINDQKYTSEGYFKFVKEKQNFKNVTSADFLARLIYKEYVENALVAYEEAHLSEKYSDYRLLLKEYRDGILLFQLMDKKVWSKAVEDTAGLRKFHSDNNSNYKWKTRTVATVYNCSNKAVLDKVKSILAAKKFEVLNPKLEDILFEKGASKLGDEYMKKLDALASALRSGKDLTIELTGSGDLSESKNTRLVKDRISAVRKYLMGKNVDSTRITFVNKGFSKVAAKPSDLSKTIKVSAVIYGTSNKDLEKLINASEALSLQINDGKFQPGENEIVAGLDQKPGVYEVEKNGRFYYVNIKSIEEPRNKTLDECRGLVISDYQGFLEKQWIGELKKLYPVTVYEEEVKKLITK